MSLNKLLNSMKSIDSVMALSKHENLRRFVFQTSEERLRSLVRR